MAMMAMMGLGAVERRGMPFCRVASTLRRLASRMQICRVASFGMLRATLKS
eukprot:CAMPEP_0177727278 /NCGR_PEP_ID=MMETSP0484_2-20121128/20235_1 /TAXON_ID=354590 /ORGANISM="Rhodomonas lens, Strain RHODO" /LENGTH=50 /DNA_ID=CAMNT_0019239919 /DNA_START=300 /DNA_END=452 /DNA_ORIENTATION=-